MKWRELLVRWRTPLIWTISYGLAAVGLLWWRLGTRPNGAAPAELAACQQSDNWSSIFHHISSAPYLILQNLLPGNCSPDHQFWLRLPATLIALVAGALFVIAVRRWFGRRAAWYGGILFITSSWFLHSGRLSMASVSLLLVVPLLLVLYQRGTSAPYSQLTGWYTIGAVSLLAYIPGGIWFIILAAAFSNKAIWRFIQHQSRRDNLLFGSSLIILWLPLIWSLVTDHSQIAGWLGLPATWPVWKTLGNLLLVPVNLVVRGPGDPLFWLGHVPILDIFAAAMAVVGGVWLYRHSNRKRQWFFVGLAAVSWLLSGLRSSGIASLSLIVPLAYFLSAAGIQAMLRRWFDVFPRNPFARWLAYSLLIIVVAGAVIYNLRAYYIAWPHARAVLELFSL